MKSEHVSNNFYKNLGVKGLAKQVSPERNRDIEFIQKFCKKSDKILDLACGYGRVTLPMAKAGFDITGIDLAPNLIKQARLQAKKQKLTIDFDVGSMINLPYPEKSFDKVICLWSSFNHLLTQKDQINTLNEISRILKPKGIAFIEMLNGKSEKMNHQYGATNHCVGEANWHLQFTPAYRKDIFRNALVRELTLGYLFEGAKKIGVKITALEFGPDHVHLFLEGTRKVSVIHAVQTLKGFSSRQMRQAHKYLFKEKIWGNKFWTNGYFYQTVGTITSETVKKYIEEGQTKHWVKPLPKEQRTLLTYTQ